MIIPSAPAWVLPLSLPDFEHRDPFVKTAEANPSSKKEEKILMTLGFRKMNVLPDARPVHSSVEIATPTQGPAPVMEQTTALFHYQPTFEPYAGRMTDRRHPAARRSPRSSPRSPLRPVSPDDDSAGPPAIEWVLAPEPDPTHTKKYRRLAPQKVLLRLQRQEDTLQDHPISMQKTPGTIKQSIPSAAEGSPKAMPEHNYSREGSDQEHRCR